KEMPARRGNVGRGGSHNDEAEFVTWPEERIACPRTVRKKGSPPKILRAPPTWTKGPALSLEVFRRASRLTAVKHENCTTIRNGWKCFRPLSVTPNSRRCPIGRCECIVSGAIVTGAAFRARRGISLRP